MTLMPVAGQLSEGKLEIGGAIVGVVLGGLYSYVAIRLDYLLSNRPAVIRGVLLLNLVLSGLTAAVGVLNGRGWSVLPYVALAFAITAYLYSSVRRLASETVSPTSGKPNQSPQPPPTTGAAN